MEIDIFKHIIEISSGFVGAGVYKLFNGDTELQDFNKNLFQYFIFAAAAWIMAQLIMLVLAFFGKVPGSTAQTFIILVCAAFLGAAWALFLKGAAIKIANIFNKLFNKNEIGLNTHMIEKVALDNQPHYFTVHKGGQRIGGGYLTNIITRDNAITLEPEDDAATREIIERDTNIKQSLIYLDKDIYLTEYFID